MATAKRTPRGKAKLGRLMAVRFTEAEYATLQDAAGGYPPATWARVELLRLALERLRGGDARSRAVSVDETTYLDAIRKLDGIADGLNAKGSTMTRGELDRTAAQISAAKRRLRAARKKGSGRRP